MLVSKSLREKTERGESGAELAAEVETEVEIEGGTEGEDDEKE
jgi:hypothetical protein